MKRSVIFILAVWVSLIAAGQSPLKNNWEIEELKGKVKSMEHNEYEAVDKFGNVTNGERISQTFKKYNNNGHIIEESYISTTYYYPDTNTLTYTYKYDNKGNAIECREGKNANTCIYKYDQAGRLTMLSIYNTSDSSLLEKILYQYDDNGNCEERHYQSSGVMTRKLRYDNKYNLLEEYEYDGVYETKLDAKYVYEYNNGKRVKMFLFEPDYYEDVLKLKKLALCNDKGDVIELEVYDYEMELTPAFEDKESEYIEEEQETVKIDKYRFTYKYDAKGNWIEKITIKAESDIATKIETREIKYYD